MVRVVINNVSAAICLAPKVAGKTQATIIDPNAEAFSHQNNEFINIETETTNCLIAAVYYAFAKHIPLELGPDVIFNTILQGISTHVSKNPHT